MYVLTVTCGPDTFWAYWYGAGELVGREVQPNGNTRFTVDYGDDEYRANYQAGRFASGLIPARVESK